MIWPPPSPTRPRVARRPTMLFKNVKDSVDANLIEVGHKLATELQQIFHPHDPSSMEQQSVDVVAPESQDARAMQLHEVNISSPLAMRFPFSSSPAELGSPSLSAESTPRLTPSHLYLSPSSSCESLCVNSPPATSFESIPDPYCVRSASQDDEMEDLRAGSARAAFRLPPRPRFHELLAQTQRRSRSSEDVSRACGGIEKGLSSPIVDPFSLALLDWRRHPHSKRKRMSSSSLSEKPLRSVRSFVTPTSSPAHSSSTGTSSPCSTLLGSPIILTRRSLSSGIGLDMELSMSPSESRAERQPSPPPSPRRLAPRRASSASSLL